MTAKLKTQACGSCGNPLVPKQYPSGVIEKPSMLAKRRFCSRKCSAAVNPPPTSFRHGMCGTRVYHIWENMKSRCLNPKDSRYGDYGGRGITVCERWLVFENFLADMGEPRAGLQLDREDNNGNYEPGNCRWATRSEQQNNRRTNHVITLKNCTQTLTEWCRELGLEFNTVSTRLRRGWSVERALELEAL